MAISHELLDITQDWNAFCQFVDESYGSQSFLKNREYVDWWFAGSPARRKNLDRSDIVVFKQDEQIIAMNGHIQTNTHLPEGVLPIAWMANTMIHPQFRRGLGVRLLEASFEYFADVGAISFNELADPILRAANYNQFQHQTFQRAFCVTDSESFEMLDLPLSGGSSCKAPSQGLAKLEDNELVAAAGELWSRISERYGVTTERSADFLTWRYLRHPYGNYILLGLGEPELGAFAVVRVDGDDVRAMRVIDIFGNDAEVCELLKHVVQQAQERKCAFVDIMANRFEHEHALVEAGFQIMTMEEKQTLPHFLNPLAKDKKFRENMALRRNNTESVDFTWDQFYLVKGDADRDRPC